MTDKQQAAGWSDCFLDSRLPMHAADSVGALIVVSGNEYLLQLRDKKPTIYYADHWGLFGGALDDGESPEAALLRELREELEFDQVELRYFTEFRFDLRVIGEPSIFRRFYEVHVSREQIGDFKLNEGRAIGSFSPEDALRLRLAPYDAFALWLHYVKQRSGGDPGPT